jgi:uncharacterized protein involved in type VI secretion and phage assembly
VLPWAAPAFGLFEGAGSDVGSFTVPDTGSYVYVFFMGGDVLSPVYFAAAPRASDGPSSKAANKKVWKSRSGHEIIISDVNGSEEIEVTHADGASVTLDSSGVTVDGTTVQLTASTGTIKVNGGKVALGTSLVELLDEITKSLDEIVTLSPGWGALAPITRDASIAIKTIKGSI